MFCRKGNVPTPSETYLPVGTFRNELFYVTGPCIRQQETFGRVDIPSVNLSSGKRAHDTSAVERVPFSHAYAQL